jgi:hypothetical protein
VADSFGVRFTGLPAYLMWGFVHVLYLIGWGSRLGTLYAWLRSLTLSDNRGYRVITEQNAQHERYSRCPRERRRRQNSAREPLAVVDSQGGIACTGVADGEPGRRSMRRCSRTADVAVGAGWLTASNPTMP